MASLVALPLAPSLARPAAWRSLRVIGLVHLYSVGSITAIIVGVLYQFAPCGFLPVALPTRDLDESPP